VLYRREKDEKRGDISLPGGPGILMARHGTAWYGMARRTIGQPPGFPAIPNRREVADNLTGARRGADSAGWRRG